MHGHRHHVNHEDIGTYTGTCTGTDAEAEEAPGATRVTASQSSPGESSLESSLESSPGESSPGKSSPANSPAGLSRSASYAGVVQLLGRPHVTLPTSQLTLGRTAPPWNAMCWEALAGCAILGNSVLRVKYALGGSSFVAVPSCFPCEHATLHFSVRFGREWCASCGFGGGRFPGLVARGAKGARLLFAPAWLRSGRLVAAVYAPGSSQPTTLLERAALKLQTNGAWNDVVLRVKLNSARGEDGMQGGDGEVSISVNGAAATHKGATWSRLPLRLASLDMTTRCRSKRMPQSAHADFSNFGIVV